MPRVEMFPEWDDMLIREIRRGLPLPVAETIVAVVEGFRLDDKRSPGIGTRRARVAIEQLRAYLREDLR
ncbi:MAG: hypothetical protein ACRDIX_07335 [Actinomycetota bacterium]